ncbi:MAG: acetate kinase [Deltaproteobacteria bacterium]|nr:MAG: acetate kinase [Deltaproteobacteria bacterium]
MKLLVFNCGSSSLKFQVIELDEKTLLGQQRRLAHGLIEKIGDRGKFKFAAEGSDPFQESHTFTDHGSAFRRVILWLESKGFLGKNGITAVGHRVVHGGNRFVEPALLDSDVVAAIEAIRDLAPLHNDPSLKAIRAARTVMGPSVPMVAVFDTAFHSNMPERASTYAIPRELGQKHQIRRFGFHGLAHRYLAERYAALTATPLVQIKIITLQLGNGCSATAVQGGRSLDNSMGLTPLEGLMMGTRSGDVDPHLPGYLARIEGVDIEEVEEWLNSRSGLLGVSGVSQDMRDLMEAERRGDGNAALAVEMFCYRVRKQIGAYLAVLGGADSVLFGGGIGENSPEVRSRICTGMEWCGLTLDGERNAAAIGSEDRISADSARVHAYVIPVDEEVMIARDTLRCLGLSRGR